jgi:hypothetical protein
MSEPPARLNEAAAVRSHFTWPLSAAERTRILDEEIGAYAQRGYRVVTRSATTAQLRKPKVFSFLWAFAWFLLFGVGLFVYVLYYAAKQDAAIYLSVSEAGEVEVAGALPGAHSSRRGQAVVVGIVVGLLVGLLWLAGNSQQSSLSPLPTRGASMRLTSEAEVRTHVANAHDYRGRGELGPALVEVDLVQTRIADPR